MSDLIKRNQLASNPVGILRKLKGKINNNYYEKNCTESGKEKTRNLIKIIKMEFFDIKQQYEQRIFNIQ